MLEKVTTIFSTIVLIIIAIMIGLTCKYIIKDIEKPTVYPQPEVYRIVSQETGVCYYATSTGAIVPLYNPDGSLYSVSLNKTKK